MSGVNNLRKESYLDKDKDENEGRSYEYNEGGSEKENNDKNY